MADELPTISLKLIGIVRNEVMQPIPTHERGKVVSEIVIDPSLTEALDNLDEFSHIIVLWWAHKLPPGQPLTKVHLQRRQELSPLLGVFATRSRYRPNPIAKTTVKLLQRQGNVLRVEGLDAINGTPVIDIKPYMPRLDSVADARVPQWITKR